MPRSWTFPDTPGVIEERRGKASSRVTWTFRDGTKKRVRKTHPLPLHPRNRKTLHALHREFIDELIREERPAKAQPTARAAAREFIDAHPDLTPSARGSFQRAFARYLPHDLDHDAIYEKLKSSGTDLARVTRRKYLQSMRRFCGWCMKRRYLERNPVDLVSIPPAPKQSSQRTFSKEEIDAVCDWHREKAKRSTARHRDFHIQHAILIELGFLTGARPSELLRAKWEDVDKHEWVIWGKAAGNSPGSTPRANDSYRQPRLTRDDHARKRRFPLPDPKRLKGKCRAWMARIRELLEELQSYDRGGWFFETQRTQKVNDAVRNALVDLGLDDGRTLRHLRHSALAHMESELGFTPIIIADLLGHTPTVSLSHYRDSQTAERVTRAIEGTQP